MILWCHNEVLRMWKSLCIVEGTFLEILIFQPFRQVEALSMFTYFFTEQGEHEDSEIQNDRFRTVLCQVQQPQNTKYLFWVKSSNMALEFTISLNYVFGHIVQTVQNCDLGTTDQHTMRGHKQHQLFWFSKRLHCRHRNIIPIIFDIHRPIFVENW